MQKNKLYVGNLSYSVDESQLKEVFASYGDINEVTLIKDRDTGRSKGFAFITFEKNEAAEKALEQDGKEHDGRPLKVNLAQEKERSDRGSRGGGFGGDKPGSKRGGFGGGKPGSKRGGFGGGGGKRNDRSNDRNRW